MPNTRHISIVAAWFQNFSLTAIFSIICAGPVLAQCSGGSCTVPPPSGGAVKPPGGFGSGEGELPWGGSGDGLGSPGEPGEPGCEDSEKDWMSWPFKALTILQLVNMLEPSTSGGNEGDHEPPKPEAPIVKPTTTSSPTPTLTPTPTPTPCPQEEEEEMKASWKGMSAF